MKNKPTTRVTLEELFNVLNYYANERNYTNKESWPEFYNIIRDNGSKARKILKKFLKDGFSTRRYE